MSQLKNWKRNCAIFAFCATTAITAHAQAYTILASFDGSNGELPQAALVQGTDGNFYGTTPHGGANGSSGTVFKITPAGTLTTIYSFCAQPHCTDGAQPQSCLALGSDGNLYGTTYVGGIPGACFGPGCGTVFEITPRGKLTTLYKFCELDNCADGSLPIANLVRGSNGKFYGTTYEGGNSNLGTVFEITTQGEYTTLYSFCSQPNCADGASPVTGLLQAADGNFYGTTYDGGAVSCDFFRDGSGCGTIFQITPAGQHTTLYSFGTAAGLLQAPVIQARDGNLYEVSADGGTGGCRYGCGTVFELMRTGSLETLYNFCTQGQSFCPDGAFPMAGLIQATDGLLYGSTETGGSGGGGTIFSITPQGLLQTVYGFVGTTTGSDPLAALLQSTDGSFYGTTQLGGASNSGLVFRLSTGLPAFVKTLPTRGKAGASVGVLGNNLTAATSVTFNGTPAQFMVKSSTLIVTQVPAGATSGKVTVTLPSGILSSDVPFHVVQ